MDEPHPALQDERCRARIFCFNGQVVDVVSLYPWLEFLRLFKLEGYVVTSDGFIPYHGMVTVMRLSATEKMEGNVVQLHPKL